MYKIVDCLTEQYKKEKSFNFFWHYSYKRGKKPRKTECIRSLMLIRVMVFFFPLFIRVYILVRVKNIGFNVSLVSVFLILWFNVFVPCKNILGSIIIKYHFALILLTISNTSEAQNTKGSNLSLFTFQQNPFMIQKECLELNG